VRTLILTLALLSTTIESSRGDPDIYGPHGENLGPNPELDLVFPDLQRKKVREEELREQNRLLQQQVQNLEQKQKQLQQQEQMQGNRQYQSPIQIQINSGYRYPNQPYENFGGWPYGNFGWGGGGTISITSGGKHHQHMNKGGHGGKGGHQRR
jgi:hypothetical protein